MSVYLLIEVQYGPQGHGDPGEPLYTLAGIPRSYQAVIPYPAFSSHEKARRFRDEMGRTKLKIMELDVMQ